MNTSLLILELAVIFTGLALLIVDLWTPAEKKQLLGYGAAFAVGLIFVGSCVWHPAGTLLGFNGTYIIDPLALFFKRFFLIAAFFVLLLSVDFADRFPVDVAEFYALCLFALSGMMFAASANDFIMLFVSLELITVTFYVLTSYQRFRVKSLEAGVKYLIMGALSTAFTLYGIALVFGSAKTTTFTAIFQAGTALYTNPLFLAGLFLVFIGLAFKLAAFPFQIWAPDVYEGSPAPATAFLAVGSKAAGIVLLLRILFTAVPGLATQWTQLLVAITAITILYGNLCAIPQRNLKRLLGYSSIGNAGYVLLGITAANMAGSTSVLYYLSGYLFTVIAAFTVISVVTRQAQDEDITVLAGLHQRSPLLATTLSLAMISLAGIPPLAGFFGKFLLLKSVLERGGSQPVFLFLLGAALFGIVVSFYYYLGVVRAIYWSKVVPDYSPISVSTPIRLALYACVAAMLFLGVYPEPVLNMAANAVAFLKF
jgi:NADH-quinone oxidoreductase subunit N